MSLTKNPDIYYTDADEKNKVEAGKLYLVTTPIGNLSDLSERAKKILAGVDFVAAEDTRNSAKLLAIFGIKKPMVSYYEHNKRERGEVICDRLAAGESCALVTDAGMPGISDPGEDIVKLCAERGIPVTAVPGPCAAMTALTLSGLATGRFAFEGFLSTNKGERRKHLEKLKGDGHTLIFYEAPHKLVATLKDFLEYFGDRKISLARELTKIHEEVFRTTVSGALEFYEHHTPKGEFVLVLEGAPKAEPEDVLSFEDAVKLVGRMVESGKPLSMAAKEVAQATGYKKGDLYQSIVKND